MHPAVGFLASGSKAADKRGFRSSERAGNVRRSDAGRRLLAIKNLFHNR
jgi:hypothetical protein